MSMIKQECRDSGPKRVIERVSSAMGGIMRATDSCQLPCNEQQVSQAKRRCKKSALIPGVQNPDDELAIVLQKACMEDGSNKFIREEKNSS